MGRRKQIAVKAPPPLERDIQAAVVAHWKLLGLPDTMVAAVPNQKAHGQPGLTKGLADLVVLGPGLPVGFIELKREPDSVVSDDQIDFGKLCIALGIPYALVIGRDQPIAILEAWNVTRRQAA